MKARVSAEPAPAAERRKSEASAYVAFDHLANMAAVVGASGECIFANGAFEQVLGLSRRSVQSANLFDWFVESDAVRETAAAVERDGFSTSRLEAQLCRPGGPAAEALPVHVIVSKIEGMPHLVVELVMIEKHARLEREERALEQAQANRELVRNLAHEIKNPLGGIRGAAQLLEMELPSKKFSEYTSVIIHEADRLQALVDRLLAPHRHPHVVGDVNIHEVCERVRSVVLAQFQHGLTVRRDYDLSIPEFRGDREQLIQSVLNIVHNATHALAQRIAVGDALITLRTRVARQVTLGKQRYRLALELHVQDNGPGVPEELRDRIFYPLVTGREGGSGLGLTLAQTFVQQHHGTVEFESEPGNTVFKILIPLP